MDSPDAAAGTLARADARRAVEEEGGAPLTQICQEILLLTKLDWNTSDFAGKEPITTAFSFDVGHILAEVRSDATPKTLYRFYM